MTFRNSNRRIENGRIKFESAPSESFSLRAACGCCSRVQYCMCRLPNLSSLSSSAFTLHKSYKKKSDFIGHQPEFALHFCGGDTRHGAAAVMRASLSEATATNDERALVPPPIVYRSDSRFMCLVYNRCHSTVLLLITYKP